jgi:hypothetical protein
MQEITRWLSPCDGNHLIRADHAHSYETRWDGKCKVKLHLDMTLPSRFDRDVCKTLTQAGVPQKNGAENLGSSGEMHVCRSACARSSK